MKILAIDSTAVTATAAVTEDKDLLGLYTINCGLTHSETMLPMIEDLLKHTGEVDLYACSVGPGSFTGVRIGVSLIKGLAFGSGKPCAGVSSLEALAYNLNGFEGLICPVMDARRSQVYNAFFQDGKRLTPDRLITVKELEYELKQLGKSVYLVGDGYKIAYDGLDRTQVNIKETPNILRYQNAYSVACCVGETCDDLELNPIYLRASQAERERNERINNNNDEKLK